MTGETYVVPAYLVKVRRARFIRRRTVSGSDAVALSPASITDDFAEPNSLTNRTEPARTSLRSINTASPPLYVRRNRTPRSVASSPPACGTESRYVSKVRILSGVAAPTHELAARCVSNGDEQIMIVSSRTLTRRAATERIYRSSEERLPVFATDDGKELPNWDETSNSTLRHDPERSASRSGFWEVRMGFEPTYDGFANHCLTAWLPHR